MSDFIEFYSNEDSLVLMGGNKILIGRETSKSTYYAALCFMDRDSKYINFFLTKKQLVDLQALINRNIAFIDAEHEKHETLIKEMEEILRYNVENPLVIDFDNSL